MNLGSMAFGLEALLPEEVVDQEVLEVGSRNFNGGLRTELMAYGPRQYVGVDIEPGRGVDLICDFAKPLPECFHRGSFDIVIATEVFEHVLDWELFLWNLKYVLRDGGTLLLTAASVGFPLHGYPSDFWRYSVADLGHIFRDMNIQRLERDPAAPEVFIVARKDSQNPQRFRDHPVYSMPLDRKVQVDEFLALPHRDRRGPGGVTKRHGISRKTLRTSLVETVYANRKLGPYRGARIALKSLWRWGRAEARRGDELRHRDRP